MHRWSPELRRALTWARPEFFGWTPERQLRYRAVLPDEDCAAIASQLIEDQIFPMHAGTGIREETSKVGGPAPTMTPATSRQSRHNRRSGGDGSMSQLRVFLCATLALLSVALAGCATEGFEAKHDDTDCVDEFSLSSDDKSVLKELNAEPVTCSAGKDCIADILVSTNGRSCYLRMPAIEDYRVKEKVGNCKKDDKTEVIKWRLVPDASPPSGLKQPGNISDYAFCDLHTNRYCNLTGVDLTGTKSDPAGNSRNKDFDCEGIGDNQQEYLWKNRHRRTKKVCSKAYVIGPDKVNLCIVKDPLIYNH